MINPTAILEAAVMVTALSLDAFVACFSYGANKIKIPMISAQVINLICSFTLALALVLGFAAQNVIPATVATGISFAILLLLGVVKLCDSLIKRFIRRHKVQSQLKFRFFSLNFILHVYADPEQADRDASRSLSPGEAAYLAAALSLDGLGVGFGAGLVETNPWLVVIFSLVTGFAAVVLGGWLGRKVAEKLNFDLSWLSGVMLIGLALLRVLG